MTGFYTVHYAEQAYGKISTASDSETWRLINVWQL
jgi:hypothetical protein